jgi:hypothetical protein
VNPQQIPRKFPTATGAFDELLVLEFNFMLPVAKYLCSNRSSVLFGRVSCQNIFWKLFH